MSAGEDAGRAAAPSHPTTPSRAGSSADAPSGRRGWEGSRALLLLMRLRSRARLRGLIASLRRPRRLVLLLLLAAMIALVIAGQVAGGGAGHSGFEGQNAARMLALLLTFLMLTTAVGALSQGVIVFDPAEAQFLFPAPVGTRALLASHVVVALMRSLSGSLVFSIFLRPWDVSFLQASSGYFLYFTTLVLLGLNLDMASMHLPPARRRHRGRLVGLVALLAGTSLLAADVLKADGFRPELLDRIGLPAHPWVAMLAADTREAYLSSLGWCLLIIVLLALRPLSFHGNLRESAGRTSEVVRRRLVRLSRGDLERDGPRRTRGWLLPMLPRWGGAGVHAWRQLSSLSRRRKSFALLVTLSVFSGVGVGLHSFREMPELMAGMMLGVLALAGPLYVQCDFRSDFDSLAWLRSMPSPPTALAAGQLLASTLVIFGFQLVLGSWVFLVVEPKALPLWGLVFASLPLVDLLQLCVENGVFLLYPHRLDASRGPPGALQLARMYALMLLKMLLLLASVLLVALPAWVVAVPLGQPVLGACLGWLLLLSECVLLVWVVGRLFVRVDPGRDLAD